MTMTKKMGSSHDNDALKALADAARHAANDEEEKGHSDNSSDESEQKICRARRCKYESHELERCAFCKDHFIHLPCYIKSVLDDGRHIMKGDNGKEIFFCTKVCYSRFVNEKKKEQERAEKEAKKTRFLWNEDGTDTVNSEQVLLAWLLLSYVLLTIRPSTKPLRGGIGQARESSL